MHKLPIGIQDFPKIRENGFVYVDKTELAYRLCTTQSAYFLSRPRRFGKSLLCSTLANMWAGKKEHFTGLWIEQSDWNWEEHPVIRIDLNAGDFSNGSAELQSLLIKTLRDCAEDYGIHIDDDADTVSLMFANLIRKLWKAYNQKVAVIIDEYDKPLLTTIDNDTLHSEIKNTLKSFYGVLKSADEHLAFLFITGVTKFSQVSVFSDLNQLVDISLDARYAALCGITQDEMEATFTEELDHFSDQNGYSREEYLQRLRNFYNGYRFSESTVSVYNPFGLLNHFSTGKF
ncbi:MAG: AAA family ATPase, partial [Fibrobacterota bacterium]